jgi:type III pantothenate kinase
MDINLVVLNVGNTRLAVGVFVAGELQFVKRLSVHDREQWAGVLAEAWERIKGSENAEVCGATVNPVLTEQLELAVKQATGQDVQWVGRDIDLPVKVATDEPEQTGVDRVLNVAAAYEQLGHACVVVDAGTAVTINCCDDQGRFVGGAIAPGLSMQLAALHENTAKLPEVQFTAAPQGAFGTNTQDAMLHGVYHGVRGLVKEVVENYATHLGRWPELIATGGDAAQLFEGWELIHAISPDLTLYGIASAYADHHIKHST